MEIADAAGKIYTVGTDFKNRLINYTRDVLNYYIPENWVMKYYENEDQIYNATELARIKTARETMKCLINTFGAFKDLDTTKFDTYNASYFTDTQIEQLALKMLVWDRTTFNEIYTYVGISRRL